MNDCFGTLVANTIVLLSVNCESEEIMKLEYIGSLSFCTSVFTILDSSKGRCVPLLCSGIQVGIIKLSVSEKLLSFRDVFEPQLSAVGEIQSLSISDGLRSPQQRTVALNNVFVKLKEQDAFPCLRGWRSEVSDSLSTFVLDG